LKPEELQFAEELRDLGNHVDVIPRGSGRTADFIVNGTAYELKTVSNIADTTSGGLSSAISNRIMGGRGQAGDIIIDARGQAGMSLAVAERAIRRAIGNDRRTGSKIRSVTILTSDGPVSRLMRR
jgi:filamentous hemagglutinin